jgi:hypothetical protein
MVVDGPNPSVALRVEKPVGSHDVYISGQEMRSGGRSGRSNISLGFSISLVYNSITTRIMRLGPFTSSLNRHRYEIYSHVVYAWRVWHESSWFVGKRSLAEQWLWQPHDR